VSVSNSLILLPTVAFALLVLSAALQAVFLLRRDRTLEPVPASPPRPTGRPPRERRLDPTPPLLLAGAALLLADLARRSVQIRFVAVTGIFESLLFFAAVIALVLFVYRLRAGQRSLPFVLFGGTVAAVFLLALASSPLAPKEVVPPIPALQSHWLVLHVTFSFIGEAFFVVAFVASIVYLAGRSPERRQRLDRLTYTAIGIGYPIFTVGALVFGAVWAEVAWGSWWSWDPKETWALVTWLVYTGYLHARLVRGWRGPVSAVLSIAGFVFTLFTLFGVNYLLSGLHSYR
jgi:ABC-type transport system involved in cytochrome c biogenesis permease subunit